MVDFDLGILKTGVIDFLKLLTRFSVNRDDICCQGSIQNETLVL